MECGDLSFITKVRLRPYARMIPEFPSQCPSHAIFMDFCKNIKEWLICLIKDEKQVAQVSPHDLDRLLASKTQS